MTEKIKNSCAAYAAQTSRPIFYSDESAAYLLSTGPRYVNVFVLPYEKWRNFHHVLGIAHASRVGADRKTRDRVFGRAAYRIVVKAKTAS